MHRIQSVAILATLIGLFAWLGYLILGPNGALLILGVGLVFNLASAGAAVRMVLNTHRARLIHPYKAPGLTATVHDLAARAKLPLPHLATHPSDRTRSLWRLVAAPALLAISSALPRLLDAHELRAVIAHELVGPVRSVYHDDIESVWLLPVRARSGGVSTDRWGHFNRARGDWCALCCQSLCTPLSCGPGNADQDAALLTRRTPPPGHSAYQTGTVQPLSCRMASAVPIHLHNGRRGRPCLVPHTSLYARTGERSDGNRAPGSLPSDIIGRPSNPDRVKKTAAGENAGDGH